jgi:long-chain acyl-CoA synthetase
MKATPIQALMQRAQTESGAAAFAFRKQIWTYGRLRLNTEVLARGMASKGVRAGDRVALHMLNRPEFIMAYYACFRLGAIAVPLRTAFTFAELAPLLERVRPALYIGDADLYPNVASIDGSILGLDKRFIIGGSCEDRAGQPLQKLRETGRGDIPSISPDAFKPAVLITTSGTTGEPKLVIHTQGTLTESAELLVKNCGISAEDIIAEPLPLAHASGLITCLSYIHVGARFVLQESFDADLVLDAMERHGCTLHVGFPSQYAALLDRQRSRPRDLKRLRYCLSGGDVCPSDLQKRAVTEFGAPLYNFWAATEAVGNLSFGLRDGPVTRIPQDAQIRLVDERDNDVADGEAGELLVRGANVFKGYWNDAQATAEALKGGWYRTGDLMRRGEDDELLFVARKKDIIIRGGTNISPVEVEQAIIATDPAVEEAAVVGVPDELFGQRVLAFVRLANGAAGSAFRDLPTKLGTRLAAYKIPERFLIVDHLPRNLLGKVDRKALQAMAPGNVEGGSQVQKEAFSPNQSFGHG